MGVGTYEQRAVDSLRLAVLADRLADSQYMPFVETVQQRAAAMAGGAERNLLLRDVGVGALGEIGCNQLGYVDEQLARNRLSGQRTDPLAHDRGSPGSRFRSRSARSPTLSIVRSAAG